MSLVRKNRGIAALLALVGLVAMLTGGTNALFTDSTANPNNSVSVDGLANHFAVEPGSAVQPGTSTTIATGDIDSLELDFGTAETNQTFTDVFVVENVSGGTRTAKLSTGNLPSQIASMKFASSGTNTVALADGETAAVTVVTAGTPGTGAGSVTLGLTGAGFSESFPTRSYPVDITTEAGGDPPTAPSGLSATAQPDGSVDLSWTASPRVWNLASDFRLSPNQANPNPDQHGNTDTWSFRESATLTRNPAQYTLLPNFGGLCSGQAWLSADTLPFIARSSGGPNACGWPAQTTMVAHPSSTQLAVVAWKSPFTGTVSIGGSVTDWDSGGGDGISWFVDRGTDSLASGQIANGGQQNLAAGTGGATLDSVAVQVGQVIYLAIDPRTNDLNDTTAFSFTITEELDGYNVYRAPGGSGTYAKINGGTPVSGTAYTDNGTAFDTAYDYRVRAVSGGVESADSNTASVTTVPAAPTALGATAQPNGNVSLAWTASATTGVTYDVYRATSSGGTYSKINGAAVSDTTFTDTTSAFDTEYFYKVRAVKSGRESANSNEASVTTVPAAPSGLSATAQSNGSIDLAWTASATSGVTYDVYRATDSAGPYAKINVAAVSGTTYTDSATTLGTTYYYRVRAVKGGRESADSDIASATAEEAAPEFRMATGTYVGNSVDNRAIAGLGFQPDVVMVKAATNVAAVIHTSTMPSGATDNNTKTMTSPNALVAGVIRTLTPDGFTVGTNSAVNSNGVTYYWTAFKADENVLKLGTYQGNGTTQAISDADFSPEYAAVFPAGSVGAGPSQRFAGMGAGYLFSADNGTATRITSLDADGFSVGSSNDVNASGQTYHYLLFNHVEGTVYKGSYTGSNQTISDPGFQPDYVLIRADGNRNGHQRPAALAGSGSQFFSATANEPTDGITALTGDGFSIGANNAVGSGSTYHYLAIKNTGGGSSQFSTLAGTNNGDSWVNQANVNQNNGGADPLRVTSAANNTRALVRFNLPATPSGMTMKHSALYLRDTASGSGRIIQAFRAGASWIETGAGSVTWDNQPATAGTAATAETVNAAGPLAWTVTSLVTDMYSGANNGFILRDATEGSGSSQEQQFDSEEDPIAVNRPQLDVTFGN